MVKRVPTKQCVDSTVLRQQRVQQQSSDCVFVHLEMQNFPPL